MLRVNEADIFALRTGLDIVVYVNVLIEGNKQGLTVSFRFLASELGHD